MIILSIVDRELHCESILKILENQLQQLATIITLSLITNPVPLICSHTITQSSCNTPIQFVSDL